MIRLNCERCGEQDFATSALGSRMAVLTCMSCERFTESLPLDVYGVLLVARNADAGDASREKLERSAARDA